jgi:serine/threonine protein kinase
MGGAVSSGQDVVAAKRPKQVQLDRLTFDVVGEREGGFGKVWFLCRPAGAPFEVVYGNKCAVKTFKAEEDDEQALIEQELGNWVSLRSQYIARLIKISRLNFELAALMEMMPGSLTDYLRQHRNMDETQVKTVLLDVLHGLEYAYTEHQLVHLDLTPNNLLLVSADSPRVQITDWGISRIVSKSEQSKWITTPLGKAPVDYADERTRFGIGTAPFMAPERFSGSWTIGPAADIFSLGLIAVLLMTGQLPTIDGGGDPRRCIESLQYFERARYLLRGKRGRLGPLVLSMLDPRPERRPQEYPALISTLQKM